MNWDEVLAVCAVMTLAGTAGLFVMRAVVEHSMSKFMEQLREEFVSKDQLRIVETRVDALEARRRGT